MLAAAPIVGFGERARPRPHLEQPRGQATSTRKPQPPAALDSLDETRITVIYPPFGAALRLRVALRNASRSERVKHPKMRKRSPGGLREHVTGAARGWPSCEEKDHDAARPPRVDRRSGVFGGLGGLRCADDIGRPDRHEFNRQITPWRISTASEEAGGASSMTGSPKS